MLTSKHILYIRPQKGILTHSKILVIYLRMEEDRVLTPPEGEIFMIPDNDNGLDFSNPLPSASLSSTPGFLGNVQPVGEDMIPIDSESDRKSTRLNSSHSGESRMPSSA